MNLNRSMAYFRIHAKSFLRSKSGVFFLLLLPVIFILLFGAIFSGNGGQKATLAVQNDSGSAFSHELCSALNASGQFNVEIVPSGDNISKFMQHNSIDQGLVIPASVTSNSTGSIQFIYSPSDPYSQSYGLVIQNIVLSMLSHNTSPQMKVHNIPVSVNIPKYVDYYLPGIVGYTFLNAIFAVSYLVPTYRKRKIFRQLELSGLTKGEWLFSMVLFYFVLTAISDIVLFVVGYAALGIAVPVTWEMILLTGATIFVGMLFFISIGMVSGLVTKNEETANLIANVIFFPMLFLSGVFFPVSMMPSYLQQIASVLPLTAMIKVLVDVLLYAEYTTVVPTLAILGVIAAGLFVVVAYLARKMDID